MIRLNGEIAFVTPVMRQRIHSAPAIVQGVGALVVAVVIHSLLYLTPANGRRLYEYAYYIYMTEMFCCYLSGHNLLVYLNRLVSEEWWIAGSHFINENSKRPPVDSLVVAFRQDYFRGKVFGSPAKCPGASLDAFGKTKISHLMEKVQ